MNKKIILSLSAAALLSTAAFASYNKGDMKRGCESSNKQYKMMKQNHSKKGQHFMKMVMNLDLTSKQKDQIKSIMVEQRKNMSQPSDAFTSKGFDKAQFIKLMQEKKDGKIQKKADIMEKVYNVLNDIQKKNLKTIMDMKKMQKEKMMSRGMNCNDKNCNGRG